MTESPQTQAFSAIESREAIKVAALDIGSNSFHLVVARIVAGSVQILHRVKQKVRLAGGLDKHQYLSADAIQRGVEALELCKESMQGFEPETVRIVATYTLRKAKNAQDFITAAREVLPYPVEVISGVEEARLIYQGVAHTNEDNGRRLVVDIGGGSTEFIIGEGFNTRLMRSLQMGCVSFNKRFFKNGELKRKQFDKAITAAQQELELIDTRYRKLGWQTAVGTSGTIRTIATLLAHLNGNGNSANGNGKTTADITLDGLKTLIDQCCQFGHVDAIELEGLSIDRRPVFAAGLAILTAIFKSLKIDSMSFSSAALREGVLYEMESRLEHHDIRERTADSLATRYDVDLPQARRVYQTVMSLYQQCAEAWQIQRPELQSLLGWAALLHEVGLQINSRGVQRHSGYILANAEMPGFNQEQQLLLSELARCHRKKLRLEELPAFNQFSLDEVYRLLVLLRISVLLNIRRQDNLLPEINIKVKKRTLQLDFAQQWLENAPLFVADLQSEALRLQTMGYELQFG